MTRHSKPLLTKSKMSQLISLVLLICGNEIPMVLDGLIQKFSSVFWPKSTLICLPLFRLRKGKPRSPCTHLLMEALAWLASKMRFWPICSLHITKSFDPIVVVDNERCYILVRLVSSNLYIFRYGYLLIGISPKRSGQWWYW